jgi:hypothetical protein
MRTFLTPLQSASLFASWMAVILLGVVLDFGQIGRFGRSVTVGLIFFLYMLSVFTLKPGQLRPSSPAIQVALGISVALSLAASRQPRLVLYFLAVPFGIALAVLLNWLARRSESDG